MILATPVFIPVTLPFFTLAIVLLLVDQDTLLEVPDTFAFRVMLDPAFTEILVLFRDIFTVPRGYVEPVLETSVFAYTCVEHIRIIAKINETKNNFFFFI